MSDDAAGCLFAIVAVGTVILFAAILRSDSRIAGYEEGYRRGFCEGRGGVEATVNDSIRCIRLPENVRTK